MPWTAWLATTLGLGAAAGPAGVWDAGAGVRPSGAGVWVPSRHCKSGSAGSRQGSTPGASHPNIAHAVWLANWARRST